MTDITLYNTPKREKEIFHAITDKKVGMYTCGPTVYGDAHIGNLRAYVTADLLRRMFAYNGYDVTQIVNITDVGHLSSDQDEGEDKMTKGLRREGLDITLLNMKKLGEMYTERFVEDLKKLNIELPEKMPRASDHIEQQISLIQTLEEKGFIYKTSDGLYFDTAQFPRYADFAHLDIEGMQEGARVSANSEKKNPADFAVWKFNDQLGFPAPWGAGFPGWHLECSAMAMQYLGNHFDVHTGGIDHVPVHHTNEVAQSECATGEPFANYWVHTNFVNLEGAKMAKSEGNVLTLSTLGVSPLAYRYWLLTAHYRSPVSFSTDAIKGAETALERLQNIFLSYEDEGGSPSEEYLEKFNAYINDDIDTPKAVALLWELVKDEHVGGTDKRATLTVFDEVLGLGFKDLKKLEIPAEVTKLVQDREQARKEKDWAGADVLRDQIEAAGYTVNDTDTGPEIRKK